MKDLFMSLLRCLENHGKITAANLYKDGKYASIEFENENAVYSISVHKEEKENED